MRSVGTARYRILDRIGSGGMGVVYKAEDLTLGRQVALKFLPPEYATRGNLLTRFEREARAAAALNHPGICTIHEVGEVRTSEEIISSAPGTIAAPGTHYIAMEYIRGETLHALVRRGPLALRDALRIGTEAAEGLAHAHAAGVVHRDLKPANIMIAADGRVKILDFGLAKFVEAAAEHEDSRGSGPSQAETLTDDVTRHGEILGTHAYMSPEQARGLNVDRRSDIFSLGTVLYEMLAGRPAFTGPTRPDIVGSILRDQPAPISQVNPEAPAELERIIGKCLEKDAADRYQNTGDLAVDLRRLRAGSVSAASVPAVAPAPRARHGWVALAAGAAAVALVLAIALGRPWSGSQPTGPFGVAVLPLAYDGPADKAYIKDVIALVLAEGLGQSPAIRVAPFASSRIFDPAAAADDIARQLGVACVVRGSLRVEGGHFEASLLAERPGRTTPAWSRTIDGSLSDLVSLSAAPVGELVRALGMNPGRPGGVAAGRNPAAIEAYLRGVTLLEGWDVQKNAVEAEKAFREAIALDPTFAAAHARLAGALVTRFSRTRDASTIAQAGEAAERGVALDPALPEANMAVGWVELQRGRSAEAAAAFERAIAVAPADDALYRSVARAYADLGRDGEAEAMFQRAIDLRPDFWATYNSWGSFCLRRGKLDRAAELYGKVIDLHPESDLGYSNLAAVYISQGRQKEAEPLLKAALRINPSVQTRNNLGTVYYALGRFDEAAIEWEAALSISKDAMLYSNLGDAYRQTHRVAEAGRAYGTAVDLGRARLAIDATDAETRAMIANALAGSGRCPEARREAAGALSGSHANPTVAYYAAVASAICRDHAAAVEYVVRAIKGGVIADVKTNPDLAPILTDPAVVRALQ